MTEQEYLIFQTRQWLLARQASRDIATAARRRYWAEHEDPVEAEDREKSFWRDAVYNLAYRRYWMLGVPDPASILKGVNPA